MNDDHVSLLIAITSCFARKSGDQNVAMINKIKPVQTNTYGDQQPL